MEASRIAGLSALAEVPRAELAELARAMGELEVEPGTTVIPLDDHGTAVYVIEGGEAELSGQDFERIRGRVPTVEGALRRLGVERTSR